MFDAPYHRVKVIGTPIGARGKPQDGDGDGFYTPFEGAPDKTPVPAQQLSEAFDSAAEAVKAFKNMRTEVEKTFGKIKTRDQANAALRKAFPNVGRAATWKNLWVDGDPPLEAHELGKAIGLLYMANRHPDAAKRVRAIDDKTRRGESQTALGTASLRLTGRYGFGMTVHLSTDTDLLMGAYETDVLNFSNYGPDVLKRNLLDGNDPAERPEALIGAYVATHEMGHVVHYNAILNDLKVEHLSDENSWSFSDYEGEERWQDPMPFWRAAMGWNERQQTEAEKYAKRYALNKLNRRGLDRYDPESQWQRNYYSEYMKGLATLASEQSSFDDMFDGGGRIKPEQTALDQGSVDGLTEVQINEARERFADLGPYADTNLYEGVAEAIAALEMGFPLGSNPAIKKLLAWMGVQEKQAKEQQPEPGIEIVLCGGLVDLPTRPYRLMEHPDPLNSNAEDVRSPEKSAPPLFPRSKSKKKPDTPPTNKSKYTSLADIKNIRITPTTPPPD